MGRRSRPSFTCLGRRGEAPAEFRRQAFPCPSVHCTQCTSWGRGNALRRRPPSPTTRYSEVEGGGGQAAPSVGGTPPEREIGVGPRQRSQGATYRRRSRHRGVAAPPPSPRSGVLVWHFGGTGGTGPPRGAQPRRRGGGAKRRLAAAAGVAADGRSIAEGRGVSPGRSPGLGSALWPRERERGRVSGVAVVERGGEAGGGSGVAAAIGCGVGA